MIENTHEQEVKVRSVRKNKFHDNYSIAPETYAGLAIVLIFSFIFSVISYLRYYTLNEHVFDLGVNASLAYSVIHSGSLIGQIKNNSIAWNKLIYIPIGLIYGLYPKEYFLMFYQNIFLSFSGIYVYLLAIKFLDSRKLGLVLCVLWFLYFPLSGVYWFDFHYMAFFPTLFLGGIYYYYSGRYGASALFLILASATDLMAPVLVVLFLLIEIGKRTLKEKKLRLARFEIFAIIISCIIFALPNLMFTKPQIINYLDVSSNLPLYSNYLFKLEFIVRVTLPFIFISFIGIEFLILLIPVVALILQNSYWPYESQLFFQYPSLYVATIFLTLLVGLKRIRHSISKKRFKKLVFGLVVLNVILFTLYTPVGNILTQNIPSNPGEVYLTGSIGFSYPDSSNLYPTPSDINMINFICEIPKGSSVLVSGNLPQLMQGFNPVCLNENFNKTLPKYIPVDPFSRFFLIPAAEPGLSNNSPIVKVNYLLNNYNYGIVNYFKGMTVYELNSGTQVLHSQENYMQAKLLANGSNNFTTRISILVPGSYTFVLGNGPSQNNVSLTSNDKGLIITKGSNDTYEATTDSYLSAVSLNININSSNHFTGINLIIYINKEYSR